MKNIIKDLLTKTRTERYAESSKSQKIAHWVIVFFAFMFIFFVYFFG